MATSRRLDKRIVINSKGLQYHYSRVNKGLYSRTYNSSFLTNINTRTYIVIVLNLHYHHLTRLTNESFLLQLYHHLASHYNRTR